LVLRNVNTDGLQVYNIAHNQVTGYGTSIGTERNVMECRVDPTLV